LAAVLPRAQSVAHLIGLEVGGSVRNDKHLHSGEWESGGGTGDQDTLSFPPQTQVGFICNYLHVLLGLVQGPRARNLDGRTERAAHFRTREKGDEKQKLTVTVSYNWSVLA
jgi:hypothetical protein